MKVNKRALVTALEILRNSIQPKMLKLIYDRDNPQIIGCPYCGKVMFMSTESSYTQKGYRRLRYRNTFTCPECEGKSKL
jgi:uncharacterized C2H2 Zn-finger protein